MVGGSFGGESICREKFNLNIRWGIVLITESEKHWDGRIEWVVGKLNYLISFLFLFPRLSIIFYLFTTGTGSVNWNV